MNIFFGNIVQEEKTFLRLNSARVKIELVLCSYFSPAVNLTFMRFFRAVVFLWLFQFFLAGGELWLNFTYNKYKLNPRPLPYVQDR